MTWTLRLYDDKGVEIAVVTKDKTYSFEVTHPDATPYGNGDKWDSLRRVLRECEKLWHQPESFEVFDQTVTPAPTPKAPLLDNKEHLEEAAERIIKYEIVDSVTLNDE